MHVEKIRINNMKEKKELHKPSGHHSFCVRQVTDEFAEVQAIFKLLHMSIMLLIMLQPTKVPNPTADLAMCLFQKILFKEARIVDG